MPTHFARLSTIAISSPDHPRRAQSGQRPRTPPPQTARQPWPPDARLTNISTIPLSWAGSSWKKLKSESTEVTKGETLATRSVSISPRCTVTVWATVCQTRREERGMVCGPWVFGESRGGHEAYSTNKVSRTQHHSRSYATARAVSGSRDWQRVVRSWARPRPRVPSYQSPLSGAGLRFLFPGLAQPSCDSTRPPPLSRVMVVGK